MKRRRQVLMRGLRLVPSVVVLTLLGTGDGWAAITALPFGVNGAGGSANGQRLEFGEHGSVFELEAYFAIDGEDLNGAEPGRSVALSSFGLPEELPVVFDYSISANLSDLWLTYQITNNSSAIASSQFFVYLDAEIGDDFTDEFATIVGAPGVGPNEELPDSWEVDEPGFAFGDIFANLRFADLDNSNAAPPSQPEDVALALGFEIGLLRPRDKVVIQVLISDNGSMANGFALRHFDAVFGDSLTLSGMSTVVEHVPGDYDGDGSVDDADFALWRLQFGSSVQEFLGADGNGDGVVNAADYTVWRDGFVHGAISSRAAVPEPGSASLLAIGVGSIIAFVHRSQAKITPFSLRVDARRILPEHRRG